MTTPISPPRRLGVSAAGFTLVELMVALLLTGVVALIARELFGQVLLGATAIERAHADGAAIEGRLWFEEACRGAVLGTPGSAGFTGAGTHATFTALLPGSDGWSEPRKVEMAARGGAIILSAGAVHATLADSVEAGEFEYLVAAEGQGGWVRGWDSPVSAPIAIRITWSRGEARDTLLCLIGERG